MRLFINIFLIQIIFLSSALAKLEIEEESFIKKMSASEELVKARIILNKEQLTNIQIPMGDKYKKEFFSYWRTKEKLLDTEPIGKI